MTAHNGTPDRSRQDLESLLRAMRELGPDEPGARAELTRRLSSLPDVEVERIVDELWAENARRRADDYELALARARSTLARGDLAAAQADGEMACRVDPVRWEAHALLGEVLERRGDTTAALQRYFTAMYLGWEEEEAERAVRRLSAAA